MPDIATGDRTGGVILYTAQSTLSNARPSHRGQRWGGVAVELLPRSGEDDGLHPGKRASYLDSMTKEI